MKFHKGDKVIGAKSGREYIVVRGRYQHSNYSFGDDYIPYYIVRDLVVGKEKRVYETDLKPKPKKR